MLKTKKKEKYFNFVKNKRADVNERNIIYCNNIFI